MRFFLCIFSIIAVTTLFAQKQTPSPLLTQEQVRKVNDLIKTGGSLQAKEPQKAIQLYSEALSIAPREHQIYIMRGFVYLSALQNLNAAERDFSRAIELAPKVPLGYYYRGLTRINAQLLQTAEADISYAIKLGLKESEAYMNLAITQGMLRKYPEALESLTQAIKLMPQNYALYYERGNIYRSAGKYAEAVKDYEQALKRQPDHQNSYINRAAAKAMLQDYQGAANDYTYLIEKTPPNVLNYYNRGYVFFLGKQYDRALEDFTSALKIDSGALRSNVLLINTYSKLGRSKDVISAATRFLKANAQDAQGFTNAGGAVQAYLKTDDFVNGEVFFARAEARQRTGDTEGACKDAVKAATLGFVPAQMLANSLCFTNDIFLKDENFPQTKQLFARGSNDTAIVNLGGIVRKGGFDSAFVLVYKNGKLLQRHSNPLQYRTFLSGTATVTQASIALSASIRAELTEYSLQVGLKSALRDTIVAKVDSIVCGDVFLVSGQSNSVLGALPPTQHNEYIRTFAFANRDAYWELAQANNNTDDYNIGGMALQAMERIVAEHRVPVCVINSGLSASTIEQHFRNDSLPVSQQSWYGRMLWRMRRSGLGGFVKAIVWYQGESNQGAGYTEKFTRVYNAWQQDFPTFKNVYVVQIHPSGCGQIDHASLREQQRRFTTVFPQTQVLASVGTPTHDGCHFGNEGYRVLGENLYRLIAKDMYKSADTIGISSPNLSRAYWNNKEKTEIALTFVTNDSLLLGRDSMIVGTVRSLAKDAFLLDGRSVQCQGLRVEGKNTIILKFPSAINATTIGLVPERCYGGTVEAPCTVYSGPWITTTKGIAALTFHNVTIESAP